MQSHRLSNCLRKLFYVEVDGASLMPVPAERLFELSRLRAEQYRKEASMGTAMAGIRRS